MNGYELPSLVTAKVQVNTK